MMVSMSIDRQSSSPLPARNTPLPAPSLPTTNAHAAITCSKSPSMIYQSPQPILCSVLQESWWRLTWTWSTWKSTRLQLCSDSTLRLSPAQTTVTSPLHVIGVPWSTVRAPDALPSFQFRLQTVRVVQMNHRLWQLDDDLPQEKSAPENQGKRHSHEMGLVLHLQADNGRPTQLRLVLPIDQWPSLLHALQLLAANADVDEISRVSLTGPMQRHLQQAKATPSTPYGSIMRHTVAHAMDHVQWRTRTERIIARRGVFAWLPVAYSNDLVHGAWWYVLASLILTVASAMVLINAYHRRYLGEDDSALDTFRYRASWVLMTVSGAVYTLGSLAFVRATHDDPPMPPLFTWYHVQSDELLGAWLFFWGTVPVLPYALLYVAQSHGATLDWVYLALGGLVVYIMGLFVHACYPSDQVPSMAPICRVPHCPLF